MGVQLDQVLNYLDREGVTEIVIAVGHPITMCRSGQMVNLTTATVSRGQLTALLAGSPIATLFPDDEDTGPPIDVDVGKRRIRVQAVRRGDDYRLTFGRAPVAPARTKAATIPKPAAMLLELEPEAPPPPPPRAAPSRPVQQMRPSALDLLTGPSTFADLLRIAQDRGASDLHIASGRAIAIRVLGELVPLDPCGGPASEAEINTLLGPLVQPHQAKLDEVGYIDLAIEAPGGGRLRSNLSRIQGGLKGTFRIARATPPTIEELGLPKELAKVIAHHQGLVVIAGPSGHGKTTTMAALVDLINASRPFHIITIEDPVEIIYPRKAAVVSQREVGLNTRSFAAALKGSLREDPDVIVIGELRDRETVEIALTAAETGHLVIATMSTPNAAKTIDRLVDMFPPEDQAQVRSSIAG
ncbi:MAG: Flp pilus assembly complex ATPase component TadA, partial [Deltaproteobacteria bacterium]|nr:Flp pilus assembly complex ATPase component TadA [Deltaproteobacteria bacterium]